MDPREEIDRLERENRALRSQVASSKKKGGWNTGCIIAAVLAVPAGIVCIAILAAVALPMYSTFKQKTKVATALKALEQAKPALVAWHEGNQGFEGISVAPKGGSLRTEGERSGAGLPQIEGMNWSTESERDALRIHFTWEIGSGCPSEVCDGWWELDCGSETCNVRIEVGGEDDPLYFNQPGIDGSTP